MKKYLVILLAFFLVACGNNSNEKMDETKVETTAETVIETVEEKEQDTVEETKSEAVESRRVVAGTGSIAEYMAALEIELVGVTQQDNVPEIYSDVTRIGAPRKINLEILGSLNPELFVGDKVLMEVNDKDLGNFEVEKLYLDNSSYDKVFDSILELGKEFGKEEKAREIVDSLRGQEVEILDNLDELVNKKVVVLFGTGESYMLATENSFVGSLLDRLGVNNLASGLAQGPRPYVKFSLESIVAENPDIILTLSHANKEQAAQMFEQEMSKELWLSTNAAQNGKVYSLNDKDFPVTGNIHIMETLKALKELLLSN